MDEALKTYLDDQFGSLNRRVDGLTQRIGGVSERVDGVSERVDGLTQGIDGVSERVDGLTQGIDGLTQRVDGLTQRVDGLAERVDVLTQRVDSLDLGQREVRVLIEANAREVRSVAESHQILYEGMTRREENLRAEMRELQRLLMVWGESSNRRLAAVDEIVAKLAAAAHI